MIAGGPAGNGAFDVGSDPVSSPRVLRYVEMRLENKRHRSC